MSLKFIPVAFVTLLSASTLAAKERDVSARIDPVSLRSCYETAHSDLNLPDLRTRIGTWNGVRLVCHNGLGPSYSFTFTLRDDKSYEYEWVKFRRTDDGWTSEKSGEGLMAAADSAGITALLESEAFGKLPTATLPNSVGWPYMYFLEAVTDGSYKAIYRDNPRSNWSARRLTEFNRLVRKIVRATGIDGITIALPDEPHRARNKQDDGNDRGRSANTEKTRDEKKSEPQQEERPQ